jgi:predicted lipid-binding transport protein (Tim44 family)
MKIYSLLFLPLLFFSSCATITRGVHDKLTVTSDPSGANVVLSTGERGVTPTKFVKERKTEPFTVTVSKPGYVPETVKVESKFGGTGGGAMAGNLLLGGAIGIGVDAGTGAYKSLYPNPVLVHLVPTSKSKTSKRTTTAVSEEKPRAKSKTAKTPAKSASSPKIETAPKSESATTPAPTATPYIPSTLETSPSP